MLGNNRSSLATHALSDNTEYSDGRHEKDQVVELGMSITIVMWGDVQ